ARTPRRPLSRVYAGSAEELVGRRRAGRREGERGRSKSGRSVHGLNCVRHEAGQTFESSNGMTDSNTGSRIPDPAGSRIPDPGLRQAQAVPSLSRDGSRLRSLLDRRILILDGAMGTMIQRYTLT